MNFALWSWLRRDVTNVFLTPPCCNVTDLPLTLLCHVMTSQTCPWLCYIMVWHHKLVLDSVVMLWRHKRVLDSVISCCDITNLSLTLLSCCDVTNLSLTLLCHVGTLQTCTWLCYVMVWRHKLVLDFVISCDVTNLLLIPSGSDVTNVYWLRCGVTSRVFVREQLQLCSHQRIDRSWFCYFNVLHFCCCRKRPKYHVRVPGCQSTSAVQRLPLPPSPGENKDQWSLLMRRMDDTGNAFAVVVVVVVVVVIIIVVAMV